MTIIPFKMPIQIQDGSAIFITEKAISKKSQSGNQMLELDGQIAQEGIKIKCRTWLMLEGPMFFKTKHYFKAINKFNQLEEGQINTESLIGSKAPCFIEVENNMKYGERPIILDFKKSDEKAEDEFKDDDIDF